MVFMLLNNLKTDYACIHAWLLIALIQFALLFKRTLSCHVSSISSRVLTIKIYQLIHRCFQPQRLYWYFFTFFTWWPSLSFFEKNNHFCRIFNLYKIYLLVDDHKTNITYQLLSIFIYRLNDKVRHTLFRQRYYCLFKQFVLSR